jgi:thioredoxin 1
MSTTTTNIPQLGVSEFDAYLFNAEGPVLVDFWAEWCGPCKQMHPVLEQLAEDTEGRAQIAKVDVQEAPDLARRYGIQAIPTFLVFKDGEVVNQARGVQSKDALAALLD